MVAITDKQAEESGIGGKFTDQNSVRYVSSTLDLPPSNAVQNRHSLASIYSTILPAAAFSIVPCRRPSVYPTFRTAPSPVSLTSLAQLRLALRRAQDVGRKL